MANFFLRSAQLLDSGQAEGNKENVAENIPKNPSLVDAKDYANRQRTPIKDIDLERIAVREKQNIFTSEIKGTTSGESHQASAEHIPEFFRDRRLEEWKAALPEEENINNEIDIEEINEELDDLHCVADDYADRPQGISNEEIDLLIDLCNGKEIPTGKRLSLLQTIYHLKDSRVYHSIIDSINGSDNRISSFLDEADNLVSEEDSEINPPETSTGSFKIDDYV